MLLFDVVRGPHSTGAAFVEKKDEAFSLIKRPGHPFNLFHEQAYEKLIDKPHLYNVMIGHNRFATVGDRTEANAHPFMFPHVIGAHNGTLDKWCLKDLTGNNMYGTDSQAIFATIEEKGVDAAVKLMSGAWALVWYDRRDHTLNMLRNSKRPLHYCYNKERTVLAWASEPDMLEYVMNRNNKDILKDENAVPQIFQPPENMLYSWHIPTKVSTKIETPDQRKVEGRAWAANNTYAGPFLHLGTRKHGKGHGGTKTTRTFSSDPIEFHKRPSSKKFRQPYKDQNGHVIKRDEFEGMVKEGCMFCNANGQAWNEFIQIVGPYRGYHTNYVCEDCYNSEEQFDIIQFAI